MRTLLLAAATPAATSSCTSKSPLDPGAVSPAQRRHQRQRPTGRQRGRITTEVVLPSGGAALSLSVTTRFGQTATMEQIREFI